MELDFEMTEPFCIRVAEEPRNHKRLKHIDLRYNFIRECVQKEVLHPVHVCTKDQVADIFTKGLTKTPILHFRKKLGLFD